MNAKFHHNIPLSSRDRAIFIFFRIWSSAKPRPMINVISQFLELDLVNINVSAKFYQNIPNGLRVKFHCFHNLNIVKTWREYFIHLATPLHRNYCSFLLPEFSFSYLFLLFFDRHPQLVCERVKELNYMCHSHKKNMSCQACSMFELNSYYI